MTDEERKQHASDTLADMSSAIDRKRRVYNNYVKHGAENAAAGVAVEIESMEAELQFEEEMYNFTFN